MTALILGLPNATTQELFSACVAHGGRGRDYSAVVRGLARLANFEIGGA